MFVQCILGYPNPQNGHHLVNYNKIHENLQAFVSSDNEGSDN